MIQLRHFQGGGELPAILAHLTCSARQPSAFRQTLVYGRGLQIQLSSTFIKIYKEFSFFLNIKMAQQLSKVIFLPDQEEILMTIHCVNNSNLDG